MSEINHKKEKAGIAHTTYIGSVTGPVSTGSGPIIIENFSFNREISTKDDFLAALRAFRLELEAAQVQGLPKEITEKTAVEIRSVEDEIEKKSPRTEYIVQKLEKTRNILEAVKNTATAATDAVEIVSRLIPLIKFAVQAARRIWG